MNYLKMGLRGIVLVPLTVAVAVACMFALFMEWVTNE